MCLYNHNAEALTRPRQSIAAVMVLSIGCVEQKGRAYTEIMYNSYNEFDLLWTDVHVFARKNYQLGILVYVRSTRDDMTENKCIV